MKKDFFMIAKKNFDISFSMLEALIPQCPDELWNEKNGGFIFWQQILHTFTGINFWMRTNHEKFIEPFVGRKVYPELEQEPIDMLTKDDLAQYKNEVKEICSKFFENGDDEWLNSASAVYDKLKNIDVIFMQIRHIQYHVGHCDSILRDKGMATGEWID